MLAVPSFRRKSETLELGAVPSTAIGSIDYDVETRELSVSFVTNGRRYVYFDVPREEADAFRHAFSKGAFFNTHIRDRYLHALVYDPKLAS